MIRFYVLAPCVLIVLVLGLQIESLRQSHLAYEQRAELIAQNIGNVVAETVVGWFRNIDITLQAAVDQTQVSVASGKLNNEQLNKQLDVLHARAPGLILLRFSDANGYVNLGGNRFIYINDREYFKTLKADPNAGMVISDPVIGRDLKVWVLICARRYNLPDGKFGGVVFSSFKLDGMAQRLSGHGLQLAKDDIFLVLNSKFSTIVRYVNFHQLMDVTGRTVISDGLATLKNSSSASSVQIVNDAFDKVERVIYVQHVPNLPLYISIGLATENVFAPWWREVKIVSVTSLLLSSLIIFIFFSNYRAQIRKLKDRETYQNDLQHQATHDALTKLPNRLLLLDRLQHAIQSARRSKCKVAVFFIDLDKFKAINDSLGHESGDEVLREMARRLSRAIREPDTVARLGGDEFVVVCQIAGNNDSNLLAQRILDELRAPVQLGSAQQVLGGSVGISVCPDDGSDGETLLKRADMAMYHAKTSEQDNKAQYYLPEMQSEADDRLLLETRLRQAISNNEMVLYYQAQVDLRSGTLTGFEALIRWNSPVYGLLLPNRFIPMAEETHLIKTIGYWVLDAACKQIRDWHELGYEWLTVAINLSAAEFCSSETVAHIEGAIKKYDIPPSSLEVELTESLSLSNPELSIETMHKLKNLGVRLAIDDFGVGYSNLGYLKLFPADSLKIDQTFTQGLCHSQEDRAIVKTVIQLAHSLSMVALAEGAETENQVRQLCMLGADRVQGFWIAHPVPAEEVIPILQKPRMFDPKLLMPAGEHPKVLVVDDSQIVQELIVEGLSDVLEVDFLVADDAKSAMSLMLSHQFLAIVADYYLPGESGVELLAHARKIMPTALRILITGSPDTQLLREAINFAGVEHFLGKPLDLEHLTDIIRKAVLRETLAS